MKKIIALSIVALFIISLGVIAFADSADEVPTWFNEMIKWKKARIEEALQNKLITEEQAKYWNERLDTMKKFHEENGFNFPMGCGSRWGRGFGKGFGRGQGIGPNGMGGFYRNSAVPQSF